MIDLQLIRLTKQAHSIHLRDPARAIKILKKAKRIRGAYKRDYVILSIEAQCYLQQQDLKNAEKFARKAVSFGRTPATYGVLAKVLIIKGDMDEAEKFIKEAIKFGGDAHSYLQLAKINLSRGGELDEAEKNAQIAVSLNDCAATRGALGEVLRKKKKYKDSLKF
jgi:tetratricopeptide (TPR) repeat protein